MQCVGLGWRSRGSGSSARNEVPGHYHRMSVRGAGGTVPVTKNAQSWQGDHGGDSASNKSDGRGL
jgi:hypothetical protein